MPVGRWEEYANKLLPRWLRGTWMDRLWTAALHGPVDLLDIAKVEAAKVSLVEHAPTDAIDYHARARLLERIDGETTEALRIRTLDAWDFWSNVGNNTNLAAAFDLYTGLVSSFWYFSLWKLGYTGGANDDDNEDNWTRHWIVIEADDHPWTRPVVGPDLVVGPGLMVGITMTQTELSRIRRTYRKHRPAHMVGGEVYVIFDATTAASVAVSDHEASGDFVRLPLHRQMVGYVPLGMTVGQHLIVGHEFV